MQIPADMVVNCMILAMVTYANQSSEIILHVGSSWRNPIKFSRFRNVVVRYFAENPLVSKNGKLIRAEKVTVLSSMASFRAYMTIRYIIPLKVCLSLIHKQNERFGFFGSCLQ
jgi:fatty acyl-CoA reductase